MRRWMAGSLALAVMAAVAAPAMADSVVSTGFTVTGLGASDGYPSTGYDDLEFDAATTSVDVSALTSVPQAFKVADYVFTVGVNSGHAWTTDPALLPTWTLSVGGQLAQEVKQAYTIHIDSSDTLTVVGQDVEVTNVAPASALFFNVDGKVVMVQVEGFQLTNGGGAMSGDVLAEFSVVDAPAEAPNVVPLPAAAWMGMSLLGVIGGVRRLRRKPEAL